MNQPSTFRTVALLGYFGLWCLLPLWYGWLAPSPNVPLPAALALVLVPLVFPLAGLLKGKAYTYAWSSFLSLLYFALGVSEAYTLPAERLYGLLEVLFSVMWFTGAILYARVKGREQKT